MERSRYMTHWSQHIQGFSRLIGNLISCRCPELAEEVGEIMDRLDAIVKLSADADKDLT